MKDQGRLKWFMVLPFRHFVFYSISFNIDYFELKEKYHEHYIMLKLQSSLVVCSHSS